MAPVGQFTVVGGGGEYSDFQYMAHTLDEYVIREREAQDGATMYPREIFNLVAQMMYNRRNKMDPLYNSFVVGGFRDGEAFLGLADLQGSNFEENHIATGYGAHIAIPLLRKHYKPNLTRDEAMKIVEMCMTVLFYRDKQTINKIQFATVSADGIDISEPREMPTQWTHMEKAENKKVQKIVQITQPVQ